ncbi:MAG: signal peptidase I, partial [Simkaniaceae bacterium]|nr:signal peptidase I [Simkaniaceae bacterium]
MSQKKSYRIKKCRQIYKYTDKQYKRRKHILDVAEQQIVEEHLETLRLAIGDRDRVTGTASGKILEGLGKGSLKKTWFESLRDSTLSLAVALGIAVIVRQSWFELYEIPSGSMRPTLKEKDRLIVSKNQYGINIPLTTKHLLFDDKLVKRGGITVFTSAGMDVPDSNVMYFYLFPGKKQLIKRLIGKPGDSIYFYGGKLYGVDKNGHDISSELQSKEMDGIDYTPFLSFEGKPTMQQGTGPLQASVILNQMNQPVAEMKISKSGKIEGHTLGFADHYFDLWGFENYGMGKLLLHAQAKKLGYLEKGMPRGKAYLVFRHHADVKGAELAQDMMGNIRPQLSMETSVIPLEDEHVAALTKGLYTARLVAKNGYLYRWDYQSSIGKRTPYTPKMKDLPDGTYEFFGGQAYQVHAQGVTTKVSEYHPLANLNLKELALFYNMGIDPYTHFAPSEKGSLDAQRFVYFRHGDLVSMGVPFMKKDDPILNNFLLREKEKVANSTTYKPYFPFVDNYTPSLELIQERGIKVPEKNYLVLGDNFAMSGDSRAFGFVPESNMRGVPDLIFWPFEKRTGAPSQAPYPFFTKPRVTIWILGTITFTLAGMAY